MQTVYVALQVSVIPALANPSLISNTIQLTTLGEYFT